MASSKCKIEIPNQLPESGLTRVQLKSWKEGMTVYLKQNEDFLHFLPGGIYENWIAADEDPNRIKALAASETPPRDETNAFITETRNKLLAKRQRDLNSMLSIIGRKVDQYDFDDVMNSSTSMATIWAMIELVYDIGRKGVHFLELARIKYDPGETPVKHYKKIYHHFMDNLYKSGDVLAYKKSQMTEDEKLSPTLLNFILFYTIETIDSRLMKKIKDKWGHILDKDTCLHDLKDIILKAIPDLLSKLESKDMEVNSVGITPQLSAFVPRGGRSYRGGSSRGGGSGQTRSWGNSRGNRRDGKKCRVCQAAGLPPRVFTSHNNSECSRWSRRDVEDLRVMILDMQVDPSEYPESDSDQDQNHA